MQFKTLTYISDAVGEIVVGHIDAWKVFIETYIINILYGPMSAFNHKEFMLVTPAI